ncbi:hypothetical protein [Rickettsiella endosymbiont of Dermanyssus gallinae]|nr:hypothetical protein [Rickettsiella endosymbiont of Dermanyssus gallinae]
MAEILREHSDSLVDRPIWTAFSALKSSVFNHFCLGQKTHEK